MPKGATGIGKLQMTGAERFIAVQLAEEMISRLADKGAVVLAIEKRWICTRPVAEGIYTEALKAIESEARKLDTPKRMARLERRLAALYRAAFAKEHFSVCLGVLRECRSLEGLGESVHRPEPDSDPLSDRSDKDLEYYQANGHWPEEKPRKRKEDPADPLDQLVH
jgi:hypothetical protein